MSRTAASPVRGRERLILVGRPLRDALYMPALEAMRFNPDRKAKCAALREIGKPGPLRKSPEPARLSSQPLAQGRQNGLSKTDTRLIGNAS